MGPDLPLRLDNMHTLGHPPQAPVHTRECVPPQVPGISGTTPPPHRPHRWPVEVPVCTGSAIRHYPICSPHPRGTPHRPLHRAGVCRVTYTVNKDELQSPGKPIGPRAGLLETPTHLCSSQMALRGAVRLATRVACGTGLHLDRGRPTGSGRRSSAHRPRGSRCPPSLDGCVPLSHIGAAVLQCRTGTQVGQAHAALA